LKFTNSFIASDKQVMNPPKKI